MTALASLLCMHYYDPHLQIFLYTCIALYGTFMTCMYHTAHLLYYCIQYISEAWKYQCACTNNHINLLHCFWHFLLQQWTLPNPVREQWKDLSELSCAWILMSSFCNRYRIHNVQYSYICNYQYSYICNYGESFNHKNILHDKLCELIVSGNWVNHFGECKNTYWSENFCWKQ